MKRNELQKKFIDAQARLDEISYLLNRARQLEIEQFEDYTGSVTKAASQLEELACSVRALVLATTFCDKKLMMADISEVHGITVERQPAWYKIVIPALLPKKKPSRSCAFIVDPLIYSMNRFCQDNQIQKMEKCVFCFRHIYTSDMPERAIRDHDNIEVKQVQDVIADKLVIDDSGHRCSNFYTSAIGKRESTEIYVMLPDVLPEWLEIYPIESVQTD